MLKMVDGTGIIGVDMVCPLGGTVSPPQPPNYDNIEMEGVGSLMLPNSLKAPLERLELIGNSVQGENPSPDNPKEIKSAGRFDEASGKYLFDVKVTGKNLLSNKPADWQIGKRISRSGYPEGTITIYPVAKNAVNVISLKPSTTYSIINNSGGIVINRIVERGSSENGIKDHDVRSSKYTFVTNQNTMNAILQFEKVDNTELLSSDIESIKIMLVEGEADENAPYEPYTEQSVQIAINEPLRGVGEYKDVLTKDGVVRRILEAPIVKYLKPVINGKVGDRYVFAEVPNANINYDRKRCMSNVGFTNNAEKKKYVPHPYETNFLIRVADDDTIEMVKEKIKDIIVAYTAKEPITEPLPESVQAQLQALHSENGVTHVFVDSGEVPCGIKLTYRKEK